LLILLKGLPLAYDRDLQEDKTFMFSSVERTLGALAGTAHLLRSLAFDKDRLSAAATEGAAWATDLAERLVLRGVPFREAHAAAGRVVASLEQEGRRLQELGPDELRTFHADFEAADSDVADPIVGMSGRTSHGGTAPGTVQEQIRLLRKAAEGLGAGN
jgi:argininosuccinate lyase